MTVERRLLTIHLPAKLLRSVVQDALADNRPVPTHLIVGIRARVICYYRATTADASIAA